LRGELDVTSAADAAAGVAACGPRVIVDLSALEYIDCSALGALLGVQQAARRAGGDVLLAAPRGSVLRLLRLTGRDTVFCVCPSVAAASGQGVDIARGAVDAC
jgi:anti-sigma B factor antagonist